MPLPGANSTRAPLRFIRLNADYTDHDLPWADLNNVKVRLSVAVARNPSLPPPMCACLLAHARVHVWSVRWLHVTLDTHPRARARTHTPHTPHTHTHTHTHTQGPGAVPGMSWESANVPSFQLTWLESELATAASLGQHVIVFVHYRLDGGPGGPVGTGLGPTSVPSRAWVDDCTLQNAAVVRDILEKRPGLVLATFSGHDHVPLPPYTKQTVNSPLYFTHHALVEGSLPHNAYSIVSVLSDCTIVVQGFVDAYNLTIAGPPGHNCTSS
jgi:hypothetical protein